MRLETEITCRFVSPPRESQSLAYRRWPGREALTTHNKLEY